ncbi:hypothetical protein [Halorussus pelagicus]|uniref:hypothetical protein n=1 Tax=Halorussus pelagicus TaxID=2505977 RepID=UPI00140B0466|nr:hypothetical protein [Halorussus pelagicus]
MWCSENDMGNADLNDTARSALTTGARASTSWLVREREPRLELHPPAVTITDEFEVNA